MSNPISLPRPALLLDPVVKAVMAAGALIRAEFHRPGGPRGAHGKAPIDTVVEALLRERLIVLHTCNWHGEELPRHQCGHADAWVVDPQDGTSSFLRKLRGSAVSVALLRHGQPVLGVVYAPLAPDDDGDLFKWAEGLTPLRNGDPIPALSTPSKDRALSNRTGRAASVVMSQNYDHNTLLALNERAGDHAAHNHATLAPAGILAMPSIAYRLALAAAGEVDAAISLTSGLDSYDIAGGHALLSAVGGSLVDLNGTPVAHRNRRLFHGCIGGRPLIVEAVCQRRPQAGNAVPRTPARPSHRAMAAAPLRRAQGALLGLLVGDALGSQVEFKSPEAIRRLHPQGLRDLLPGGTWNLLAGQPTDDGEMALALARALLSGGGFARERVAAAYVDWKDSQPFDIGTTTSRGIDALRGRGSTSTESQSNGALMRVAPIGIASAGHPAKAADWARQDASLTHPHPVCAAASAAYAAAVAVGVAGSDAVAMWSAAYGHAGDDAAAQEIRQCLVEACDAPPPHFTRRQGYVLTAFTNAFHHLWIGTDFEDALTTTVMEGGDTDTNGAICVALLGANQGRAAIPARWRNQVLGCRAVKGSAATHARPPRFWADDALELAEALLSVGLAGDRSATGGVS